MTEEEKKKNIPWADKLRDNLSKEAKNAENVLVPGSLSQQASSSTHRTDINLTPEEEKNFEAVEVDYKPEPFKYNPNSTDNLLAQISKYYKPPVPDEEREKRLQSIARVNAFGDLMKHLGALAGGGYAPTERRQENKNVLRVFQELDKMRDLYNQEKGRYDDTMARYAIADRNEALQRHNAEQARKIQLDIDAANREERARGKRAEVALKRGTTTTAENVGKNMIYKNMVDGLLGGKNGASGRKGGSSSDDKVDFVYRDTDGVFNFDKSRLVQFYSNLEKNQDKIKSIPLEERRKYGIGGDAQIGEDLEIMVAALTGKISLNDANFKRIVSKYMDAFRDSDMMKYVLAGSFVPYESQPEFVPKKTTPYENKEDDDPYAEYLIK